MIDRLFYGRAEQGFPTERFDDMSSMPKQGRVKAKSRLSPTPVSSWTLAASEVGCVVTRTINEHFDGRWTARVWKPPKQI